MKRLGCRRVAFLMASYRSFPPVTPNDYRRALTPILRHAKSLVLVDPWLNSRESRYFETIAICSNVMGQRGHDRLQGRIYIHAECKNQRPYDPDQNASDYLDAWEDKLRHLISIDGHRFKVFLWRSLPGSESMHGRFILTDQCGILTLDGLDCRIHSHANRTYWDLMSEEARQQLLQDYDPLITRLGGLSCSEQDQPEYSKLASIYPELHRMISPPKRDVCSTLTWSGGLPEL